MLRLSDMLKMRMLKCEELLLTYVILVIPEEIAIRFDV